MTDPLIVPDARDTVEAAIDQALTSYSPTDAAIAELAERYELLEVHGVGDPEALALVHEARMDVRDKRVGVEKTRKALKSDALEFGRRVDSEAKRITGLLMPIEGRLKGMEADVAAQKAEIADAAARIEYERLQVRVRAFAAVESELPDIEIMGFDDQVAAERLVLETEKYEVRQERSRLEEAEAARLEKEQFDKEKAEREELERELEEERERRRLEGERLREEAAELAREREILEAERLQQARREREIEFERAKQQAAREEQRRAELARLTAEVAEREAERARQGREAEAERLRPQREQIAAFANVVLELKIPAVDAASQIRDILVDAASQIAEFGS